MPATEITRQEKGKFSILVMKPRKVMVREPSVASHQRSNAANYHADGPTNLKIEGTTKPNKMTKNKTLLASPRRHKSTIPSSGFASKRSST